MIRCTSVTLSRREIDQIGLLVSLDNSCRYCFGYQRMMMRALGVPEVWIRQVEEDLAVGDLTGSQRSLLDYARGISRANPLPGAAQLRELDRQGVAPLSAREAAGTAAFMICFNRAATIAAIPPQRAEKMPNGWRGRLMLPLMRRFLNRSVYSQMAEGDVPSAKSEGIFSRAVEGLAGLPHAHPCVARSTSCASRTACPSALAH